MKPVDRGFGRSVARFLCLLLALACAGDAAAQINERDRLERCANNRARIAQLQAAWPSGEAGWSDERIARARTAMQSFARQQREVLRLARGSRNTTDPAYQHATAIAQGMNQAAREFDILCYPFSVDCAVVVSVELDRKIQAAEAARPQREQIQRQLAPHQTNLVALGCDRIAAAQGEVGAGNASAAQWMTGTFESSFGTLTLSPGGGSYDYYGGQVQASIVQGNMMEGIWTQTRAARQCPDGRYYGRFRFAFTADGFSGSYGYCDEEPGSGAWNGTRR